MLPSESNSLQAFHVFTSLETCTPGCSRFIHGAMTDPLVSILAPSSSWRQEGKEDTASNPQLGLSGDQPALWKPSIKSLHSS